MKTKLTYKIILKEIRKFLLSCLCVLGLSYIIPKVACRGFKHPECISSSSGNVFNCATMRLSNYTCEPQKLVLSLVVVLTVVLFLLARKKKISKSWAIYFLILSIVYFLAGFVVDYAMSATSM